MTHKSLVVVLALFLASPASASQIVQDQLHQSFPALEFLALGSNREAAQVFTPGKTGKLATVDLGVIKGAPTNSPLLVSVVRLANDEPSILPSDIIATQMVNAASIPFLGNGGAFDVSVDFSASNIPLTAGSPLAILLHAASQESYTYYWYKGPGSGAFTVFDRGALPFIATPDAGYAANFRTFVEIPEPSALALSAASLLAFAQVRRRQIA